MTRWMTSSLMSTEARCGTPRGGVLTASQNSRNFSTRLSLVGSQRLTPHLWHRSKYQQPNPDRGQLRQELDRHQPDRSRARRLLAATGRSVQTGYIRAEIVSLFQVACP